MSDLPEIHRRSVIMQAPLKIYRKQIWQISSPFQVTNQGQSAWFTRLIKVRGLYIFEASMFAFKLWRRQHHVAYVKLQNKAKRWWVRSVAGVDVNTV